MSIQKIIQESISGNPLEMKEALVEELKNRIAEALAARTEEFKQIDEISKKTLGSYVAKASTAAASDAAKYGQQGSSEKGLEHFRKAYSRLHNIKKAASKLAKEEAESINEVSKNTLRSYINKKAHSIIAKDDASDRYGEGLKGSSKERIRDFEKLNLARKKLSKD
jgi:hypothetical protein